MAQFTIPIEEIIDLLGLERSPKNRSSGRSIKVHCPFCGHKGYTMDVDVVNCVYHCFHCPEEFQKHTGALDLYSRVRLGAPSYLLDRKKVFQQLCEELGSGSVSYRDRKTIEDTNIYPAEDSTLDKAYTSLLSLPYLKLSAEHIDNLVARGLTAKAASQCRFASIPESRALIEDHPYGRRVSGWYWSQGIEKTRMESPVLCKYSWQDVVAGVLIAEDLMMQGVNLEGVPGFYRITDDKWAIRYERGMMIPTISYEGNIVGIQTRRDSTTKNGLRYLTLSSKGLPEGVTANISRTHVVYNQKSISENTQVYVTEGPLKADIILWYLTRQKNADVALIALQGVNNTKEIPAIAGKLRNAGVHEVYSAFDMDKCGNIAVAEADKALRMLFQKELINVYTMVWDPDYAKKKRAELISLAEENDIPFLSSGNDYVDIGKLAQILTKRHIEYNVIHENGKTVKTHWRPETKGYDDYLHMLSNMSIQ